MIDQPLEVTSAAQRTGLCESEMNRNGILSTPFVPGLSKSCLSKPPENVRLQIPRLGQVDNVFGS